MDEMRKNMEQVQEFLQEHGNVLLRWKEEQFGSFICMIMEIWCGLRDRDVVQFSADIAKLVAEVNEQEGRMVL